MRKTRSCPHVIEFKKMSNTITILNRKLLSVGHGVDHHDGARIKLKDFIIQLEEIAVADSRLRLQINGQVNLLASIKLKGG